MRAAGNADRAGGPPAPPFPIIYAHTGGDEKIIVKWKEVFPSDFWRDFRFAHYDDIIQKTEVEVGHYIFADLERLDAEMRVKMTILWRTLADSGMPVRLLNHPNRAAMRYELLRRLYEAGFNAFNAYRLAESRRPERFPVFVRLENDHRGARTGLLHDAAELDDELDRLIKGGLPRELILIQEYLETADDDGVYRKYGAFKIGDEIIPAHIFFSKDWLVKKWELGGDELLREEARFIDRNPFEDQIGSIFEIANIDYGRIDFAVKDGRVQTWEINTHPIVHGFSTHLPERRPVVEHFFKRMFTAFQAISRNSEATGTGPVAVSRTAR